MQFNTHEFGLLTVSTTLCYYDGPKTFLCNQPNGDIIFGYWADCDDNSDVYYFCETNSADIQPLMSGEISVRHWLQERKLTRVAYPSRGHEFTESRIPPGDAPSDTLPEECVFICKAEGGLIIK